MNSLWVPIVVAIVAAVSGYFIRDFDKRKEREAEEYRRKEERYVNLINSLRGFTVGRNRYLQEKFVSELNLAWLYCPDDVIKKAYALLSLGEIEYASDGRVPTNEEKEKAIGELFLALRRDLFSRKLVKETTLSATDFKLY